jgi:hypothetical protein
VPLASIKYGNPTWGVIKIPVVNPSELLLAQLQNIQPRLWLFRDISHPVRIRSLTDSKEQHHLGICCTGGTR